MSNAARKKRKVPPPPAKPSRRKLAPAVAPGLVVARVPIGSLELDTHNARAHSEKNIQAIKTSLTDHGQRLPLIVRDGVVLGGNATLRAMRELEWTEVDITEVVCSDAQARKLKIALNRTAELATWDYQVLSEDLAAILKDVGGDFEAMATLGWDKHEIEPLLEANWTPAATSGEDFPTGDPQAGTGVALRLTEDEAEVFDETVAKVRKAEGDDDLTKGQVLVILCRRYRAR